MKPLFTVCSLFLSLFASAQYALYENFEVPYDLYRANFYIDTENCSNNIWQIGRPQKAIFDSAYTYPNAIVTDTLNPIPAHDTSIFYVTTVGAYGSLSSLAFYYKLDIDTNSIAKIEISGDVGLNWIDPLKEDTTYDFYWIGTKPRLDTSTTGWCLFMLNMDTWSMAYPPWSTYPHYRTSDTMMFRFTFISGDSVESHDGWMLDNFLCQNTGRVLVHESAKADIQVFPNPSTGNIRILSTYRMAESDLIIVYDLAGREVYRSGASSNIINLPLPDGMYTLKYLSEKETLVTRIAIQR